MVWLVLATSTLSDFSAVLVGHTLIESARGVLAGHTLIESVRGVLPFHLNELGEIAFNLPASALPAKVQTVLPVVGLSVCILAVVGASRRKTIGVVETYLASYAAIILAWPFYDPRFWLPVIPFLIAYTALALERVIKWKNGARIVKCYVMMFVLAGLVTMVSNTALSFSGPRFGDLYTGGYYHSTYCVVWHCSDLDSAKVDVDALHLLRTYK